MCVYVDVCVYTYVHVCMCISVHVYVCDYKDMTSIRGRSITNYSIKAFTI